jgi:hypothetical protein
LTISSRVDNIFIKTSLQFFAVNNFFAVMDFKRRRLFDLVNSTINALSELDAIKKSEKPQKLKHLWVQSWVAERPHEICLYHQLEVEDPAKFMANFRMSPAVFEELLDRYIKHLRENNGTTILLRCYLLDAI